MEKNVNKQIAHQCKKPKKAEEQIKRTVLRKTFCEGGETKEGRVCTYVPTSTHHGDEQYNLFSIVVNKHFICLLNRFVSEIDRFGDNSVSLEPLYSLGSIKTPCVLSYNSAGLKG